MKVSQCFFFDRADHGVSHVAVSLCSFQPVQNDLLCNVVMVKNSVSGFAMPCDLRKKAALTNFLRDIRWCLMFVFVSVVPLFLFFLILS